MSKFEQGDLVEVIGIADDEITVNKVFDSSDVPMMKFVGRVGRIVEVKTGGFMSVGNTPKDPLYVVHVPALGRDGFWSEELKKLA